MSAPTFADLCEAVRDARRAELRGIARLDRAEAEAREAKGCLDVLTCATERARIALDTFIDRETTHD